MNPPVLNRGFPYFGLGTTPVSGMNAVSPNPHKPMWTPPIGFPAYSPYWPSMPPWNLFQRPMFSVAELNAMIYGHLRRNEDAANSLTGSALSMGYFPFSPDLHPFSASHQRSKCENLLAMENEPSDLPQGLAIFHSSILGMPRYSVFTKTNISKGTRFGPFRGRIVPLNDIKPSDDCSAMWEVFDAGKLSHYVDGRSDTGGASWMSMVHVSKKTDCQNMEAVQQDGEIFFQTTKEIPPNTELIVGYGTDCDSYHAIPLSLKKAISPEKAENGHQVINEELPIVDSQGYSCERCGKMFTYEFYLKKHLKYTRCIDMGNRGYPCPHCARSFEKRDRLRIHILHVHEKYKPHVCAACGKAFSQSSSLNKHIRVHTGVRPYRCVHCSKTFTASSILRTHIRQHSGEKPFKCKFCGKSFASHAAHDSHVRRTHANRPVAQPEDDNEELLVDV